MLPELIEFSNLNLSNIVESSEEWWDKSVVLWKKCASPQIFNYKLFESLLNMPVPYNEKNIRLASWPRTDNSINNDIVVLSPRELLLNISYGKSIVLNHMDRYLYQNHELMELYRDLSMHTGTVAHAGQLAAFYTPESSQAFGSHFDENHVFTLQISGTKVWRFGVEDAINVNLSSGDVLYVPYGLHHEVLTTAEPSLSVAIILEAPSRSWFNGEMAARTAYLSASEGVKGSIGSDWMHLPSGFNEIPICQIEPKLLHQTQNSLIGEIWEGLPCNYYDFFADSYSRSSSQSSLFTKYSLRLGNRADIYSINEDWYIRSPGLSPVLLPNRYKQVWKSLAVDKKATLQCSLNDSHELNKLLNHLRIGAYLYADGEYYDK
ncbi:hypothetical protein KEM60_01803 [Austwickia sp. TVS 96-490-7B]|nr:hypothetical protein [Austwickia sp. TVS 96-490-7B]